MKGNSGAHSKWQIQVLSVLGSIQGTIGKQFKDTTYGQQRTGQTLYQKIEIVGTEARENAKNTRFYFVLTWSALLFLALCEVTSWFIR
jgi:hypothetical protein